MANATPDSPPAAIAVAPNGGRKTKSDHAKLPLTADELARDAAECLAAGAAMIHVHVRDRSGRHLLDAQAYDDATRAIRAEVGAALVVQITTEAVGLYAPEDQIALIKQVRPEAASLALRELVPDRQHEDAFAEVIEWMDVHEVRPQIILYTPADAIRLGQMLVRGLLPWSSVPVLFVLGSYGPSANSRPGDLLAFLGPDVPRFAHWSVCAFGRQEIACVTAGTLLGGHARVGFENNLYLPDGSLAGSNADLVTAAVEIVGKLGQRCASADELRADWARVCGGETRSRIL